MAGMNRKQKKKRLPFESKAGEIRRPGRYVGRELYLRKIPAQPELSVVLSYPDVYEIGMSHFGLMVLYHTLAELPDIAIERVFTPWPDMEDHLRRTGQPLTTLETKRPLHDADVVFITVPHELTFTNILTILDLGGIPLEAHRRSDMHPLVILGGIGSLNPLPLSLFADAFLLGDGEEAIVEIVRVLSGCGNRQGTGRDTYLRALSGISGCYVPAVHGVPGGSGEPPPIEPRIISSLEERFHPSPPLVPFCKPVHERVVVEVSRGCPRRCRFCQARVYYGPVRRRSPGSVMRLVRKDLLFTGYDEVSLLSLNVADVPGIEALAKQLMEELTPQHVSLSLPSLRPEKLSADLVRQIARVRKTGFTLAPEAGSERLRRIIGKSYPEDKLLSAAEAVFRNGWSLLKLYFMVGLPFETEDDIDAMIRLIRRILEIGRRYRGRRVEIHVSASTFIPKPHTPFQWVGQAPADVIRRRLRRLKGNLPAKAVRVSFHDPDASRLEALLARGDHRYGEVILKAFRLGCRFDAWHEWFKPDIWWNVFGICGIDPAAEAEADLDPEESLPWDFIRASSKSDVLREYRTARREAAAPVSASATPLFTPAVTLPRSARRNIPSPPDQPETAIHYTALFSVTGVFRLFGHRDICSAILRAARAARWPLRYSQGFNPRPKVTFAQPAPLGLERYFEPFSFQLFRPEDPEVLRDGINRLLPPEIRLSSVFRLRNPADSPFKKLISATYGITKAARIARATVPGVLELDPGTIQARLGRHADAVSIHRFDKCLVIDHTIPGVPSVRRFFHLSPADQTVERDSAPVARLCWNFDPVGEQPWCGDD